MGATRSTLASSKVWGYRLFLLSHVEECRHGDEPTTRNLQTPVQQRWPVCLTFGGHYGWAIGQDNQYAAVFVVFNAHKRVKGRKRYIVVDTSGLPIACRVEPANTYDRRAASLLLGGLPTLPWHSHRDR